MKSLKKMRFSKSRSGLPDAFLFSSFFTLKGTYKCCGGPQDGLGQKELKKNSQKPFSVLPGIGFFRASVAAKKTLPRKCSEWA